MIRASSTSTAVLSFGAFSIRVVVSFLVVGWLGRSTLSRSPPNQNVMKWTIPHWRVASDKWCEPESSVYGYYPCYR